MADAMTRFDPSVQFFHCRRCGEVGNDDDMLIGGNGHEVDNNWCLGPCEEITQEKYQAYVDSAMWPWPLPYPADFTTLAPYYQKSEETT